jgi:hypothetical protein
MWRKKFPDLESRKLKKNEGELIVFFEAGVSPEKIPRDGQDSNLPRYTRRSSDRLSARIKWNEKLSAKFEDVLDIEKLSINYLEDRIGKMIAAKIAGLAAKGAVAYGVGKLSKDSDLGQVAFIAMLMADRADLRSWKTLPAKLQMLRLPLSEGLYDMDFQVLGINDAVLETIPMKQIKIRAGHKSFFIMR